MRRLSVDLASPRSRALRVRLPEAMTEAKALSSSKSCMEATVAGVLVAGSMPANHAYENHCQLRPCLMGRHCHEKAPAVPGRKSGSRQRCRAPSGLEVVAGGEPEAAAVQSHAVGGAAGLGEAVGLVGVTLPLVAVGAAEVLVEEVVDGAGQAHVLCQLVGAAQMEELVAVQLVAHLLVERQVLARGGQAAGEALPGGVILTVQAGAPAVVDLPGHAGGELVLGCVGQQQAFVVAGGDLGIREGIAAAQVPGGGQLYPGTEFDAPSLGAIDIDQLTEALLGGEVAHADAVGLAGIGRIAVAIHELAVGNIRGAGDTVGEAVVERRGAGGDAPLVVVAGAQLVAGALLRIEVRRTDGDGLALAAEAGHAVVELVEGRRLVAAADATLEGPIVAGVPHQIAAGAEVAAEGVVVLVAAPQGQGQVLGEPPLVLGKQRPAVLTEHLAARGTIFQS